MLVGGATSSTMRCAMRAELVGRCARAVERDRRARVAAGGDRGLERDAAEQLDADLVGQRLPAALPNSAYVSP